MRITNNSANANLESVFLALAKTNATVVWPWMLTVRMRSHDEKEAPQDGESIKP